MKKFFTLISMALVAMSINAQTESWYVNNEDGTLKADYVANEDASAMSVVKFSTTNVEGTHTSGPVAGYNDGALKMASCLLRLTIPGMVSKSRH